MVIKIKTDGEFTPGNNYRVIYGKKSFTLKCIKLSNDWTYFSSEKSIDEISIFFNNGSINGNLSSDNGIIKTSALVMKAIPFLEERIIIK